MRRCLLRFESVDPRTIGGAGFTCCGTEDRIRGELKFPEGDAGVMNRGGGRV